MNIAACSSMKKHPAFELIHHGVRTATGGAVRLQNTLSSGIKYQK
jgi:hypothetical protein